MGSAGGPTPVNEVERDQGRSQRQLPAFTRVCVYDCICKRQGLLNKIMPFSHINKA